MKRIAALIASMRCRVMVNAGTKPYVSVKVPAEQEPLSVLEETLGILGGESETPERKNFQTAQTSQKE